jgi:hypothetical protein
MASRKSPRRGRPPKRSTSADRKALADRAKRFRSLVTGVGWDYAGLSREMARSERLSVTESALRKYADGSRPMPLSVSTEIAAFFDVRVRWLHHGEEPVSPYDPAAPEFDIDAARPSPAMLDFPYLDPSRQLINKGRWHELTRFEEQLERLRVSPAHVNVARSFARELLALGDRIVTLAVNRRRPPADGIGAGELLVPDNEQPRRRIRWYRAELDALLERIKELL